MQRMNTYIRSLVHRQADVQICRVIEQNIESAIDSRNEALSTLRELGPPDLVHLTKQSTKSGTRQVSNLLF